MKSSLPFFRKHSINTNTFNYISCVNSLYFLVMYTRHLTPKKMKSPGKPGLFALLVLTDDRRAVRERLRYSHSTRAQVADAIEQLRHSKATSIVLHFADDFVGQAFHLFGLVEEEVELNEFGSRFGDLAQTFDAG